MTNLYYLSGLALFVTGALAVLLVLTGVQIDRHARRNAPQARIQQTRRSPAAELVDWLESAEYQRALVPVYLPTYQPPAPAAAAKPTDNTTYWISSATLATAYQYLLQKLPNGGEPEWMLAVTGIKLPNGTRTLEHLMAIKLNRQNGVQAAFDMADFTRVAVMLHEHGQALHAILHSHRFAGPPGPSGVDLALQRQLDGGGYPAIQAVFSEDGYVRFFAGAKPWQVQVHGSGVESCGPGLWRIVERSVLPGAEV